MKTARANVRRAIGALTAFLLALAMAMPAAGHARTAFAENAPDGPTADGQGAPADTRGTGENAPREDGEPASGAGADAGSGASADEDGGSDAAEAGRDDDWPDLADLDGIDSWPGSTGPGDADDWLDWADEGGDECDEQTDPSFADLVVDWPDEPGMNGSNRADGSDGPSSTATNSLGQTANALDESEADPPNRNSALAGTAALKALQATNATSSPFTVTNVGSNTVYANGSFTLAVENVGTITVTGTWRNRPTFTNANSVSNAINWSISGDTSRFQLATTQTSTVRGKGGDTTYSHVGINFNVLMPAKRVGTGFTKTTTPRSFLMEACDVSTDADYSASAIGLGQDGSADRWLPLHTYVSVEALGMKTYNKKRYTDGTLAISTTLTSSYADVNGLLDGQQSGDTAGYGTFDFNVGGTCVADDVSDYHGSSQYGSSWSITDVKASVGHTFDGAAEGALSGTIEASDFQAARLQFHTNTYTVTYDANGATAGTTPASSHTYGQEGNLTANGFERPGFEFLGWSPDRNAQTASYADGQGVSNLTEQDGETITLYAVWGKHATLPNTGSPDMPVAATMLGISGLATGATLRLNLRERKRS